MTDTREKLIDLIRCADFHPCKGTVATIGSKFSTEFIEDIADHLIANGVTLGKPLVEHLHPIDAYEGLKEKYLVFKADTGEQVVNGFVLRPDKDTAAVEALRAYARSTDNKNLSDDIYNWVGKGEPVQKWIPVTERLPENDYRKHWKERHYYLVRLQHGQMRTARYGYKKYDWWVDSHNCVLSKEHHTEVTHWMPPPEPLKGE